MTAALTLSRVRIALGARVLIPPLDLTVAPGAVVTIMGPSGAGKSTLLAWLGGFLDRAFTASGDAQIAGERLIGLPPEQRRLGILFQDDLLFPHLSVGDNIAFGLRRDGRGRDSRRAAVAEALSRAGLEGYAERDPATLSGGQRARVALMRTLVSGPRALLLDEPFGKLDARLRDEVRRFVFDHARAGGLPTLLVTHDEADAAAAGGPILAIGEAEAPPGAPSPTGR
jgi:putative thiamine transport system ATP-binding protein